MNHSIVSNLNVEQAESDCLIVAIYQNKELSAAAGSIDKISSGSLSEILEFGDFTGKSGEAQLLYKVAGIAAKRLLIIGCGEKQKFDAFALRSATKTAVSKLANQSVSKMTSLLGDDLASEDTANNLIMQAVLGAADSRYQFTKHKSEAPEAISGQHLEIAFTGTFDGNDEALNQASAVA